MNALKLWILGILLSTAGCAILPYTAAEDEKARDAIREKIRNQDYAGAQKLLNDYNPYPKNYEYTPDQQAFTQQLIQQSAFQQQLRQQQYYNDTSAMLARSSADFQAQQDANALNRRLDAIQHDVRALNYQRPRLRGVRPTSTNTSG